MNTPLARFRLISLLEGASFLLLLFVAMPLKYGMGLAIATKVVGWPHGVLFVAYLFALLDVALAEKWRLPRIAYGVVASFLPFGPFIFDRSLRDPAPKISAG